MRTHDSYRHGAPCWVDTWQPDPHAAARFYGSLLGWSFDEPAAIVAETGDGYMTARLDGRIAVEDVDKVAGDVATLGGAVAMAPFDAAGMRNAVIADPQGAVVALSGPTR